MNQKEIANYFKSKYGARIDRIRISKMLRGIEPISWPFASNLAMEFPGRTTQQWKTATPEDLKRAFAQLDKEMA